MTNPVEHRTRFYKTFKVLFGAMGRKVDEDIMTGYWKALSNYDLDLLTSALDELSRETSGYLPAAADIIDRMRILRADRAPKGIVPDYCEICGCSGMILTEKIHNKMPYTSAYRCECANGDRQDERIPRIRGLHLANAFDLPRLEQGTLETIRNAGPGLQWPDGIEISLICDECHKPYSIRYEGRTTAAALKAWHIQRDRPHLCELCHAEEGRRRGLWT